MKYEIYIQEPKKSQKFCKKAIAEYEKRLSRYCKISCKFIKKEKEWNSLLTKDTGMKKILVQPGKAKLTSEKLSTQLKTWEGSGMKGVMLLVPEWDESSLNQYIPEKIPETEKNEVKGVDKLEKIVEQGADSIESLILSDFTMSSNMTGMVLYEQIYRGYRILHNHPYHK